jgi:hypothetical protein
MKTVVNDQSYSATIEVASSPGDVFTHITNISKWWTKDIEGRTTGINDEFTIRHGAMHYSKQRLIEVIPDTKLVWLVTDCQLNWIKKDKTEWTNTRMVFEISPKGNITELKFTHEGLVPKLECYARVCQSWATVIKDGLYNLINESPGNKILT